MKHAFIVLTLFLVSCSGGGSGGGGGGSGGSPYPGRLNPTSGWTAYGTGTGVIAQLPNPFLIPAQSSGKTINYAYTAAPSALAGKTMTLNYSVDGNATFAPLPEAACGMEGCGPAQLRLFIWNNGPNTSSDRWWCATPRELVVGDNQVLSCAINNTWTGVLGEAGNPVGNTFAVGFTFGGMFAGHGVRSTSGSATFKVNSFTVQ